MPWALVEPDTVPTGDDATRKELFGSGSLGLLYSGNLGRAHAFGEYVELARRLRGTGVHFCFAGRGHRAAELRRSLREDDENVTFADFVPEDQLLRRLTAADIQLVSLRPEWTGLVVPSKFFGALAVGRPVLFLGADDSAIAEWIRTHGVGWVLNAQTLESVAEELRELAQAPERLAELQHKCHRIYHAHFSRRRMMDAWDVELRKLLASG